MTKITAFLDTSPEGFVWAAGIENTFIGQTERAGERVLDEFDLTDHYRYWREDLDRVASLGVRALRYGLPWYKIETQPGKFDWDWSDRAIAYAAEKGIEIIFDLMHYGVPLWLENQFLNTDYEKYVADWAYAAADRYRDTIRYHTPFNETLICSEFAGLNGIWPPYLRGSDGQVKIIRNIARGMTLTIDAIRAARTDAVIVQVDAAGEVLPGTPELAELAALETAKTFAGSDLVVGLVDGQHSLVDWFLKNGMSEGDLDWFRSKRQEIDIFGTNYYSEMSVSRLDIWHGKPAKTKFPGGAAGMIRSIEAFASRYGKPVMLTETSLNGTVPQRAAWLAESVAACKQARALGLPLVGYTWFPVFDLIDWVYRAGRPLEDYILRQGPSRLNPDQVANFLRTMRFESLEHAPLEAFMAPMGLWTLKTGFDGSFERIETELVAQYRSAVAANDVGAIGELAR